MGTSSIAGMSVIDSPPRVSALVADAELARVLDDLDHTSVQALSDAERLDSIKAKTGLLARVQAFLNTELAEAESRGVTQTQFGVTTGSWVAAATNALDSRQAGRVVKQAVGISRFPVLEHALRTGDVSIEQAEAIYTGLQHLPTDLDSEAVERADQQMADFASSYNPAELRRLGNRLIDVIAPTVAEADAAAYLQRLEAEARRTRSLRFHDDHHGNWRFHGQLPITDGAQLAELINALACSGDNDRINTTDDESLGREERCWSAKCADALVEIIHTYQATGAAPGTGGGDRPRINVTIDLATLRGQLGHATLGNGAPITAEQARRLACDANILPVVLDGLSAPVDVGRDHRLVTGALRLALNARDQGCCYPGCEKPPTSCEGHHIVPWWSGGRTALDNTALLCRHHHQLVEPNPNKPPDDQWELRLDRRGLPNVRPPKWVDRTRTPRQHVRYQC